MALTGCDEDRGCQLPTGLSTPVDTSHRGPQNVPLLDRPESALRSGSCCSSRTARRTCGCRQVEPGESPWAAVVRECREELGIEAVASPITGELPLFLTVTRTRGQRAHTDASLWHLLNADADTVTSYDQGEFEAIRWLTDEQVLEEPVGLLDPHMHRFTRKLQHARTSRRRG
ncbi:NUDIX hydrolase [Streptomyces coeruleorubidus]|uniref:NUDIX hydrolase n=1 Tax=Streptomyces coeruleorubidus TaxID=116188 RepID=UPI0037A41DE0